MEDQTQQTDFNWDAEIDIDLLLPREFYESMPRRLARHFAEPNSNHLPPLRLTSRPVRVAWLEDVNQPLLPSLAENFKALFFPDHRPLNLTSQPVPVPDLGIDRGLPASLAQNIKDRLFPEELSPLHLTSVPVNLPPDHFGESLWEFLNAQLQKDYVPKPRPVTEDAAGAAAVPWRGAIGRSAIGRKQPEFYDVPSLLLQLKDDLTRSRQREAAWVSIIAHLVIVLAIILGDKYLPSGKGVVVANPGDLIQQRDITFLEAPPDAQKDVPKPETNIASDKNRVAMSKHPTMIDRKTLDELRDARRPGAPGVPAPPSQQGAQAPSVAQASPGGQPAPPGPAQAGIVPPRDTSQQARLEPPPAAGGGGAGFGGAVSPGTAIEQAARAAARRGGSFGGGGGDYGLGGTPQRQIVGNMEVLSDTMGVDFGPYLSRVLHDVRQNWYTLIPEAARPPLLKKGDLFIRFAILKDGRVAGMTLERPSGDVSLDRAAWGGITGSNPFPPLPQEFRGEYLELRFHFFYNPERNEMN